MYGLLVRGHERRSGSSQACSPGLRAADSPFTPDWQLLGCPTAENMQAAGPRSPLSREGDPRCLLSLVSDYQQDRG